MKKNEDASEGRDKDKNVKRDLPDTGADPPDLLTGRCVILQMVSNPSKNQLELKISQKQFF